MPRLPARLVVAMTLPLLFGSCIAPGMVAATPATALVPAPSQPPRDAFALDTDGAGQGRLLHGTITPRDAALTLDGMPVAVAADGAFIIAFDRDAPPVAHLSLSRAGTVIAARDLMVAPGGWRIERSMQIPSAMRHPARTSRRAGRANWRRSRRPGRRR